MVKPREAEERSEGRCRPWRLWPWAAAVVLLWTCGCTTHPSRGWPGWGGPGGDFKVRTAGLSTSWPSEGPPQLWSREVGDGYAGILADGKRLYTLYRQEADEVVVALEPASGRTLWQHRYAPFAGPS